MGSKCCANHGHGAGTGNASSEDATSYYSTHDARSLREQQPSGTLTLNHSMALHCPADPPSSRTTRINEPPNSSGVGQQPHCRVSTTLGSSNPLNTDHPRPNDKPSHDKDDIAELREQAKRAIQRAQPSLETVHHQQQQQHWHTGYSTGDSIVRSVPKLGTTIPTRAPANNMAPPLAASGDNGGGGDCDEDPRSPDEFSINSEASASVSLSAYLPATCQRSATPLGRTGSLNSTSAIPVASDPLQMTKLDGKSRRASKVHRQDEDFDEERRDSEVSALERSFDGGAVLEGGDGGGTPVLPRMNSFDQYLIQHIKEQGEQSKVAWFRGAEHSRATISRRDRLVGHQRQNKPGFADEVEVVAVSPVAQHHPQQYPTTAEAQVRRSMDEVEDEWQIARKEQLDQGGTHVPHAQVTASTVTLALCPRETLREDVPPERGRQLNHVELGALIPPSTPHKLQLAKRNGPIALDFCI